MFNNKLSLIVEVIISFVFSIIYYKLKILFVKNINDVLLKDSLFYQIFYYFFIIFGSITILKSFLFVYIKKPIGIILITTIFGIYLFISAFYFNYYFFINFFIIVIIYYYITTENNIL